MTTTTGDAPEGFSKAAESYDAAVRHNIAGSERLVMSLPEGDYARVLDVGGAWFETAGQEFDLWDSDESRLKDAVSSYGWGLTINFGGLDLNWDFAKRWDLNESLEDGFETSFWIGTQF